jgi:hypothetical protein
MAHDEETAARLKWTNSAPIEEVAIVLDIAGPVE